MQLETARVIEKSNLARPFLLFALHMLLGRSVERVYSLHLVVIQLSDPPESAFRM
jgi:hypothetical protein